MTELHGQRVDKLVPMLVTSLNPDLALPLCYLSGASGRRDGPVRRRLQLALDRSATGCHDRGGDPMNPPLNADDLATALTNGAAGWLVLSVAAVLPMIWTFTLVLHFARPTVMRFLRSLTLRFGGDVWWLSYVLFRDALLVITLGLSMLFFMPNLYFVEGLPITAPVATLVLFWALCVKIIRDPDEDFAAFRLLSILLVVASVLYIVPQIYGLEAADQTNLGDIPSLLTSSTNLAVARPIFWVSLALFAISAGVMFVRAVLQIRDAEPVDVPAEPPDRRNTCGSDRDRRRGRDAVAAPVVLDSPTAASHNAEMSIPVSRLNHAVLFVRDAERAADFYQKVFGFEIVANEVGGQRSSCARQRRQSPRPRALLGRAAGAARAARVGRALPPRLGGPDDRGPRGRGAT